MELFFQKNVYLKVTGIYLYLSLKQIISGFFAKFFNI